MIDFSCIEFYNTPDGEVMVKKVHEAVFVLKESHRDLISAIIQVIDDRYPEAFKALSELYSKSSMNRVFYEFQMAHRFCRCNFGNYDTERLDVDTSGNFNIEQVNCPLRNTSDCPYCGIICSPKINSNLTDRELEIIKLVAAGYDNNDIAAELQISMFTVIRHRNNMRAKLKINNTPALVNYYNTYLKM